MISFQLYKVLQLKRNPALSGGIQDFFPLVCESDCKYPPDFSQVRLFYSYFNCFGYAIACYCDLGSTFFNTFNCTLG